MIVEISHTSIILQVADVGINRFIKQTYKKEYTASICASNLTGNQFDDVKRIGSVVRTIQSLKTQHGLISKCFTKCGLLCGYNEVAQHFPSNLFNAGRPLRDLNLPQVNTSYVKSVLSIMNLAAERGSAICIPESVITERQNRLEDYAAKELGFREFCFALGSSAVASIECGTGTNIEPLDVKEIVTDGVRRLFKLGKAMNVPRGAPGRLSTVFGSLASAVDQ